MGLTRYKLGDLIEVVDERNLSGITKVLGLNKDKEFMPTVANTESVDLSKYKTVKKDRFAFSGMQTGRDKCIRIGMFDVDSEEAVISPAYTTFEVHRSDVISPTYLFMFFNSKERDRLGWFCSDSSIRSNLDWDRFCDFDLDLPSIEIQQKYVDIYNAMVANQKCYEDSLEDLKLACDVELEKLMAESIPRVALGNLFDVVDERNSHGECTSAMGINISKSFMESKASIGELKNYKLVKPGQFAFSGMQTGRDKCIRIALYDQKGQIAISPAYTVLKSINDAVDSNYLMMLFEREESDRLGWFLSDSSIRSNLDLDRFFEIEMPIPNESIMKSLGNIRKVLRERTLINERMKLQIKDICPILIKGSLEEASKS